MLAVCNSWLKGCRIDYFLLPRSWENCSLYSIITSHMSADHSFSAVNWYPWSKSKKKSSYEISFLSNSKMYINSLVYIVRNVQRHPISLENKTTDFCCVWKVLPCIVVFSLEKNQANDVALTWYCNTYSQPNIQQLWWFTVTPEWKVSCSLETVLFVV